MLAAIEVLAEVSVARGCGFAGLAILTFMVGLSWDVVLASKVGGLLVLLGCSVLIVKAQRALRRPVRNTELWMMLDHGDRPSAAFAQRVIGEILRTCYLRFALHAVGVSAALLTLSLCLRFIGSLP